MQDPLSSLSLVHGIDVSKSQGTVDWTAVQAAGYAFAYVKATDGQTYVDPTFEQNWTGAASAGLLRGAYHFFRAEDSPQAQAEFFWQTVGGNGDLPLVIDVEESMSQTTSTVISNLTQLLEELMPPLKPLFLQPHAAPRAAPAALGTTAHDLYRSRLLERAGSQQLRRLSA